MDNDKTTNPTFDKVRAVIDDMRRKEAELRAGKATAEGVGAFAAAGGRGETEAFVPDPQGKTGELLFHGHPGYQPFRPLPDGEFRVVQRRVSVHAVDPPTMPVFFASVFLPS